jgi:hypothetical protein
MDNIIAYKEGASFLAIEDNVDDGSIQSISWEENITSGSGTSYGGELLLQKKQGCLNGWVGYTLSWTKQQFPELNGGKEFFARYDRRHDISVVLVYEIKENITLSGTWVYGTGNAITLPISSYKLGDITSNANISRWFNYNNYGTEYTERNGFRMEAYHRADIGLQISKPKKHGIRTWEFSAYNMYNRRNPFFYYIGNEGLYDDTSRQVLKKVSIFPILPSVSWNYKFN